MEKLSIKMIKFQEIIEEENIRYSVFREHWVCFNSKIFYAKTVWFNRAKETGLNSASCLGCKSGVYLGWRGFWWDFSGLGFLFVSGGLGREGKSGERGEFEVSFCLTSPGYKVRGQPVFLQRSVACFFSPVTTRMISLFSHSSSKHNTVATVSLLHLFSSPAAA